MMGDGPAQRGGHTRSRAYGTTAGERGGPIGKRVNAYRAASFPLVRASVAVFIGLPSLGGHVAVAKTPTRLNHFRRVSRRNGCGFDLRPVGRQAAEDRAARRGDAEDSGHASGGTEGRRSSRVALSERHNGSSGRGRCQTGAGRGHSERNRPDVGHQAAAFRAGAVSFAARCWAISATSAFRSVARSRPPETFSISIATRMLGVLPASSSQT